ncbi:MAG: hypothetical protein ABIQ73_02450 [Acidimicrobiales bacterium]
MPVTFLPIDDPLAVSCTTAIRAGDVAHLAAVLAREPTLATERIGDTKQARSLLHVATDWPGHFPNVALVIATLVAAGADIEAPGSVLGGGSPLTDAVGFGQWRAARRLVERGAFTRLFDAAALGLMDRVEGLGQSNATRRCRPKRSARTCRVATREGRPMSRIAVIGDFDPTHETHTAIATAVGHSDDGRGREASKLQWLATPECETMHDADFADHDGLWIAPGSPYQSLAGALRAIQFARTHDVALLGTCAGFQHVVLEYARNVMGFADADHAEYDPYGSRLFVTPLSCSLVGQTLDVSLTTGTIAAAAYGAPTATERYYCNFGMNLEYLDDIVDAGLVVSGVDPDGEPRVIELPDHRFFVATLFVPQTSSTPAAPHPIIDAFLSAADKQR